MILFIALQLAVTTPRRLAPHDSAKLIAQVNDAEFRYIMDWRHEWAMWRTALFQVRQSLADEVAKLPAPPTVLRPAGTPNAQEVIRYDIDQHEATAHVVRGTNWHYSLVPWWVSPVDTEPADEALGIDNPLPPEYQDTVRARRVPLLALLDSAAHTLPGDAWLAGQRVRMHVDQKETALALRATTECRAAAWWCQALRGYVRFNAHDAAGAAATFDTALKRMPPDIRCQWNDVSLLLTNTARGEYQQLSCAQQEDIDARVWWLADPLYLVPTNDRRTEHYARRVLAELHTGIDADEREDMREAYTGPAFREMVLRYGWPTTMAWSPPPRVLKVPDPPIPGVPTQILKVYPVVPGWSRFDTRDTYLGPTDPWATSDGQAFVQPSGKWVPGGGAVKALSLGDALAVAPAGEQTPWPARPMYWGPQYHTVPAWSAINDPLHAQASDWDLGPARQDALVWDSSWWATEFYQRYEGPLVDLTTQIAFIRRHTSAAIVAAPQWAIDPTILAPPTHAVVGVITSGGPAEKPRIVGVKMDGARPRAILTPVESRPLLLGVEMVPENDSGAAARTRFGIAPPAPLSALKHGEIALSDVILVHAAADESFPTSIQDVLPRMYGSTTLANPTRLAIFWEVYGQADGDTVDVSVLMVRRNDAGLLSRAGATVGIGHTSDDSISVQWREPRPGDPLAFSEGGVPIRPRGNVLNIDGLAEGAYTLSVRVSRRGVSVVSRPREFTIVRR